MIHYPLYKKAKELLFKEYRENFEIVKNSSYHKTYMNEKIRHSLQVSGAGNGILAHEPYFMGQDEKFIDLARTAILLHDIYRFREIRLLFETGKRPDHGIMGAELLSQTPDFSNILIYLPIKHHGHMIECLYEDPVYLAQNEKMQDKIKHIAFAVRDADKIANWYLLSHEWNSFKDVWIPYPNDFSLSQAKISDELWSFFARNKVAPYCCHTNADMIITVLCWLFDMNYPYSISFCKYHDLFNKLCNILQQMGVDKAQIAKIYQIMQDYVQNNFHIAV